LCNSTTITTFPTIHSTTFHHHSCRISPQRRGMAFAQASFLSRRPRQRKPVNAPQTELRRDEATTRWLPAAKGNLKRQRAGAGHKMTPKSRRQKSRTHKDVYATRSQLRKLKKIMPVWYSMKRRNGSYIPPEPINYRK
jgi:ribosomal protein L35